MPLASNYLLPLAFLEFYIMLGCYVYLTFIGLLEMRIS